jgi:uncharacterized protein
MMKKKGYFSDHRPKITYCAGVSRNEFISNLRNRLDNNLARITLVATEDCNLRCKYCVYSGEYLNKRSHSNRNMSLSVMKKAIDFYAAHSSAEPKKSIGFYGGEPFANYNLLKEAVAYARGHFSDNVKFHMTTNGTLLNKDRIKFLEDNNIALLVSLDGPKQMNDRYRVFKNNKGTFDNVAKNLRLIKSMYPEYYKRSVRFNMVLAPMFDFETLNSFISETDLKPANIRFGDVSVEDTHFFDRFDGDEMKKANADRYHVLETFNHKLAAGIPLNDLEQILFRNRFLFIHQREMSPMPGEVPSNGQCMIGEKSLVVKVDGTFDVCTQVHNVDNLGDVVRGFNYEKIEEMYTELEDFFSDRCHDCWAIRLCRKCMKHTHKNGQLDDSAFNAFCEVKKPSLLKEIKDYITIREQNNHALDYLESVDIN